MFKLDQASQPLRKRLKDPKAYATLLNQIHCQYKIFSEPYVSILVSVEMLIQVAMAMIIMTNSSIVDSMIDETNIMQVKTVEQHWRTHFSQNQLTIECVVLGYMLLFIVIQLIEIVDINNRSFITTINRYTLTIMALLTLTALKPILGFLILQCYFIKDDDYSTDHWMNVVPITLACINILLYFAFGVILPKLYAISTAFIDNPLARMSSLYPLMHSAQQILFQVTFIGALTNQTGSAGTLVFMVPVTFVFSLLTIIYKVFRFTQFPLNLYIGTALEILVTAILLVTTLFQGYIFDRLTEFSTLILYALLLAIGYIFGFYFLRIVINDRKWRNIFVIKPTNELQYTDGLKRAAHKLKILARKGPSVATVKDLLQLLSFHSRECKDSECMCRLHYKIIGISQKGITGDSQEDESLQPIITEFIGKDQSGIIGGYLNKFMLLLTKKALDQFPDSLLLTNLGLEFVNTEHAEQALQAQLLLVNLKTKGQSFFHKIQKKQLDMLVHQKCQKFVRNYGDQLTPDELIQHHILQNNLQETLVNYCIEVQRFWSMLLIEQFDVYGVSKQQNTISSTLIHALDLLQQIEESGQERIHTYHTYAMLHRLMFNDIIAANLYMRKLQSISDLKKIFDRRQGFDSAEVSFMIVNSEQSNVGKILLANKRFHQSLGYDKGELNKNARIDQLIPNPLRQWHSSYINNMMQTGKSPLLSQPGGINTYVVRKDKYIVPMNLQIQLIYCQFGFVYMVYAKDKSGSSGIKDQEYSYNDDPFFNEQATFICEEDDYRVMEITKTCKKLLKVDVRYLTSNELATNRDFLSLYDIFPESQVLDVFVNNRTLLQEEETLQVDKNIIQHLLHNLRFQESHRIPVKLIMERHILKQSKKDERNAYIVAQIITDQEVSRGLTTQMTISNNLDQSQINAQFYQNQFDEQHYQDIGDNPSSSQDSTHTHSSSTGGSPENIKQFLNSSSQMRYASKSLRMVLQLVLLVFALMFGISVLNLALTIKRHETQRAEIEVVKMSYDRLDYFAKVRILVRCMINMANGYEPLTSQYTSDRFGTMRSLIQADVSNLQDIQNNIDDILSQQLYGFSYSDQTIRIYDMDSQGNILTSNYTISSAYQLFYGRTQELMGYPIASFAGRTEVQQIITVFISDPTYYERLVNMVVYNAMGDLKTMNQLQADYFTSASKDHALQVKNENIITVTISVAAILIIALAITPMAARFQKRKYESLQYFLQLSKEQINLTLENCQLFLTEMESQQSDKIIRKKSSTHSSSMKNQQHHSINTSQNQQTHNLGDIASNISLFTHEESKINELYSQDGIAQQDSEIMESESYQEEKSQHTIPSKNVQNNQVMKGTSSKQVGFSMKNNKSYQKSKLTKSDQEVIHEEAKEEESVKHQTDQTNQDEEEALNKFLEKKKQISRAQGRVQTWTVIILAFISTILSLYFIGTLLLTLKTFNDVPTILDNLQLLFYKDACVESAIDYVRENQVLNVTVMLSALETDSGVPEVASTYTIAQCYSLEEEYRILRKNPPNYFSEVKQFFSDIETNLCPILSGLDNTISNCDTIYNGVMAIGYSYAVQQVLNTFNTRDVYYFHETNKTYDWIISQVQDTQSLQMIEANEFLISTVSSQLKLNAMNSTLDYFDKLRYLYIIVFCVFLIVLLLMLIIFLAFHYKKMKYQSLLTNQSFRILPLEYLKKEELGDLRTFCQT